MRSGDSRNPSAAGILPAQDHSEGVSLEHRSGTLAWRVVKPPTRFGEIQYDADTVGDVTGWTLWETASRPIPGWRQAWPSIVPAADSADGGGSATTPGGGGPIGEVPPNSRTPGAQPPVTTPGGGFGSKGTTYADPAQMDGAKTPDPPNGGATFAVEPAALLPLTGSWTPDVRYRRKTVTSRAGMPDFPAGTVLVVTESTDETRQVEHALHTDPRLIATHRGSTPTHGTPVCDVTAAGAIDRNRSAALQSALRVVPTPSGSLSLSGNRANALSWTIGVTGLRDALGGFVTDGARGDTRHARVNIRDGGPFDTGPSPCKHRLGADADGYEIDPLHWSTLSFWNHAPDGAKDGPLDFEDDPYPAAPAGPVVVKTRLLFDPDKKYQWPRDSRQFSTAGKWRWHSYCFVTATTPGGGIPDTKEPTDPPPDPDGPGPGTPGGDDDGGPTTPGGGGGGWTGGSQQRVTASADRLAFPHYGTTPSELSLGVISAHPQPIGDGLPDLFHTGAPSPRALAQHQYRDPVTARSVPYGAQRGGEWSRTQEPGASRYAGGTGHGGWLHLPPEVDALDATTDTAPVGVTRSTRTDVWAQGSRIAFGSIDHATGKIADGYLVSSDGAGGLTVSRVVAGVESSAMALDANGVAFLRNAAVAPAGTPVDGGYLYCEAGALKYKGSSGSVTTLGVA